MRYEHWDRVIRVAFSVDGCFIFSGGWDNKISQWEVPDDVLSAARQDPLFEELFVKVTISNYYSMHELTRTFFTGHIKRAYLKPTFDGNTALYKSSKDLLGVCGFTSSSSTFSYALSGTDPWPAPQYGERAPPEVSSKGCSRSIPIFW